MEKNRLNDRFEAAVADAAEKVDLVLDGLQETVECTDPWAQRLGGIFLVLQMGIRDLEDQVDDLKAEIVSSCTGEIMLKRSEVSWLMRHAAIIREVLHRSGQHKIWDRQNRET